MNTLAKHNRNSIAIRFCHYKVNICTVNPEACNTDSNRRCINSIHKQIWFVDVFPFLLTSLLLFSYSLRFCVITAHPFIQIIPICSIRFKCDASFCSVCLERYDKIGTSSLKSQKVNSLHQHKLCLIMRCRSEKQLPYGDKLRIVFVVSKLCYDQLGLFLLQIKFLRQSYQR